MTRRVALAIAAMTASQAAVYVARPMTSYRLLGVGAGAREIGFVTASFALLPLVLAIPLGRAADRRRTPFVTIGCLVQIAACLLLAWAGSPATLGAASAVLGLGHLGVALGVQEVIARESSAAHHDRHFGWLTAGVSLGQLVGPLLGGFVVAHGGALLPATSRAMLAGGERGEHGVLRTARAGSVRTILGTQGVPAGIFASIAVLSAADIFTAYLPVIGDREGIGPAAVGVLLALRAGASMSARIGIGSIVARVGRVRLITISAASAAVAFGAIALVHGLVPLAVVSILLGFGLGFGQPLSMTLVVQLVPESARATALAVRLTGNRVGQVAAPAAAGVISGTSGVGAVFWLTALALAASAAVVQRPAVRHAGRDHAVPKAAELEADDGYG
jgi:MFS family permease